MRLPRTATLQIAPRKEGHSPSTALDEKEFETTPRVSRRTTPVNCVSNGNMAVKFLPFAAAFDSSLGPEHCFNVETTHDHPLWHNSETVEFLGEHD